MYKVIFIALSWWLATTPPIPYRQLSWSDYKGVPTNSHMASTCSGIVIEKDTAYAIFEPDRSWTRTNDVATLRHEQLHFAITKVYAELISKIIRDVRLSGYNYIDSALRQWADMEQQYDNETDHGRNTEAQKQWEEKIKM